MMRPPGCESCQFGESIQTGNRPPTATPKETKYVSNINYFGEPTYSYSLKQGIRDGFLAPHKVIKVHLDVDIEGYRPTPGEKDITGAVIPDCRGRHCEGPFVPVLA